MSYANRGDSPGPLLITLIAATLVFGSYLMWMGFTEWMDENAAESRAQDATQESQITATFEELRNQPTLVLFPTNTPIPPCQYFTVKGPQAAFVRECPSTNCEDVSFVEANDVVCVVGLGRTEEYPNVSDWYAVILEPDDFLPDVYYMAALTLRSNNPTPRPTNTFEPLPTVTPIPPTPIPSPSTPSTPTPTPEVAPDDENVF
jgi:hypothetical protein